MRYVVALFILWTMARGTFSLYVDLITKGGNAELLKSSTENNTTQDTETSDA